MSKIKYKSNLYTLAERIKWVIMESKVKQVDFAKSLGISANYIYLLTSGKKLRISETLARLIEEVYGYSAEWILTGRMPEGEGSDAHSLQEEMMDKVKSLDYDELLTVSKFIETLKTEK